MAKLYKAKVGFSYPADADSFAKTRARRKALDAGDAEKAAKLWEEIKWARHEIGDKPFPAPSPEILKSWQDNDAVEEVKSDG